jgi:hypothetical protein
MIAVRGCSTKGCFSASTEDADEIGCGTSAATRHEKLYQMVTAATSRYHLRQSRWSRRNLCDNYRLAVSHLVQQKMTS